MGTRRFRTYLFSSSRCDHGVPNTGVSGRRQVRIGVATLVLYLTAVIPRNRAPGERHFWYRSKQDLRARLPQTHLPHVRAQWYYHNNLFFHRTLTLRELASDPAHKGLISLQKLGEMGLPPFVKGFRILQKYHIDPRFF